MKLPKIEDILVAYGVYHENDELEKADIIAAMKEYALLVIARCTEAADIGGPTYDVFGNKLCQIDVQSIISVKNEIE